MLHVIVTSASRHGSTREIAEVIATELERDGIATDLRELAEVHSIEPYDAVILGSAVYMGNWLPEARRFVERHREPLSSIPLWLFSSGPVGAPVPQPEAEPQFVPGLLEQTHAREHRIFAGKLDKHCLSISERLATKLVRAQEGDFRDWTAIRAWAHTIAAELQEQPALR